MTDTIYSIHNGERSLLYQFFQEYFKDQVPIELADVFFLYISLKIRIRKEFVQTNPLYGFENFKIYESRKAKFCNNYKLLYPLYAVQSSIRENSEDCLEARVTPNGIPQVNFQKTLSGKILRTDINKDTLSFVIHFIKKNERKVHRKNFGMRYDFKADYAKDFQQVISDTNKRNPVMSSLYPVYKIVGIDAAGEEIECSPAVFGHIYRYARECGMTNMTYHVGEDFYDLADGLKNIDDAIRFLNLQEYSRLGHAIALGVDSYKYYANRGYQVIMSKQKLLDVLVWLNVTCINSGIDLSKDFINEISIEMEKLYKDIGYSGVFDKESYYESMLLRSDDPVEIVRSWWDKTSMCQDEQCINARKNSTANKLCMQFLADKRVWTEGNKVEMFCYTREICAIIEKLQNYMMAIIAKKGIAIESNPSSNVKIAPISGYNNLPVFRFISNGLNVSINTDDKGIFATSLPNEYSLIANAYYQKGHTITEAALLIERLKKQSYQQRFSKQEVSTM